MRNSNIIRQKTSLRELSSRKIFKLSRNLSFLTTQGKGKKCFLPRFCTKTRCKASKREYFYLKVLTLYFLSKVCFNDKKVTRRFDDSMSSFSNAKKIGMNW